MLGTLYETLAFWLAYTFNIYAAGFLVLFVLLALANLLVDDLTSGKKNIDNLVDKVESLYLIKRAKGAVHVFPIIFSCLTGVLSFFLLAMGCLAELGYIDDANSFNSVLLAYASVTQHVAVFLIPVVVYFFLRKTLRSVYCKFDRLYNKLKQL